MSRSFSFSLHNKLERVENVDGLGKDSEGQATIEVGPLVDVRFPASVLGLVVLVFGIAIQVLMLIFLPKGKIAMNWGEGTACWFVVLVTYALVDLLWTLNPFGKRTIIRRIKKEGKYYNKTPDPLMDANGDAKTTNAVHCAALMAMVRATSIFVLVVDPAVDQRDVKVALYRGFVLGWAAHALYTTRVVVEVEKYPVELLGFLPLAGGVVSSIASLAGAGLGLAFQ